MKNKLISTSFIAAAIMSSMSVFAVNGSNTLNLRTTELERKVEQLQKQINFSHDPTPMEMYAHGPAIVSSPVFSLIKPGSEELMVHLSRINRDLEILKLRQKMDNYAISKELGIPLGPMIALSGGVEGQVQYNNNYNYSKNSQTEVDLTRAELDITGEVGKSVTATMIISYDNGAGYSSPVASSTSVTKVNNSRLQIDRAFITLGQLNSCPFYFSLGQLYAPFGIYDSYIATTPSTRLLGRVKDRMAVVGYSSVFQGESGHKHHFDSQIYGLSGSTLAINDSKAAKSELAKHGGLNATYKFDDGDDFRVRLGAGVLGNLAESDGMQQNVFGGSSTRERIHSRVLGYNLNTKVSYRDFDVIAEYVGASTAFDSRDLPYNGKGAKPKALEIEGAYSFKIKDKPNTVYVGYGSTSQALALNAPKTSYFAGYSIAFLKDTITSIEYRHDTNYSWGDSAVWTGGTGQSPITVNGRRSGTFTLFFGLYF